jgi:RHS repeat-associated protein
VSRRFYDPFGVRVASAGSWPDDKGFLGLVADGTTGWDLLGARQYNPATGAFLSLDPVLEAGSPVQMGGYAYAGNNPATASDPTGLMNEPPAGGATCEPGNCVESGGHDAGETGGTATTSGGGGGHGPGSPSPPSGPCWWGGFSVASCAHANTIYTPEYLAALNGPSQPSWDPLACLSVAQLFMSMDTCSPGINLAATGKNDETGDTSGGAADGGIPADDGVLNLAKLISDLIGAAAEAAEAQSWAQDLQALRGLAANDHWNAENLGTTTVIGVRNTVTGQISIRTGINGPAAEAPDSWPQWAKDAFTRGDGHAEMGVLNTLGENEVIEFGGTSRNVCWDCYRSLSDPDIRFGGRRFPGMSDKSPFRMFWRDPGYPDNP